MDVLQNLLVGFTNALTPMNILFCFLGVIVGTAVGILPGLGPAATIAMLLPLTFGLDPATAMIMMAGIYYGAMYGGSITSILINTPGESSSVATTFDGYPLACKGKAGAALGMAMIASMIGGTLSIIGLTLISSPLASFALKFGPPEYFSLMFLGLVTLTFLAEASMTKALLMGCFGLFLSTIGIDVLTGAGRFTFNKLEMMNGINFIIVAMGLFALGEVLSNLQNKEQNTSSLNFVKHQLKVPLKEVFTKWRSCLRGSIIGFIVGVLPGAGATIASFMSYAAEKKISKRSREFGTGALEGVAVVESANNAATGGSMVPLLTLGVPGSAVTAIMLGALMMYGLRPGPLLMEQQPIFVWTVIASMYLGNLMLVLINLPLIPLFASILKVPYSILYILILVFTTIGVYSINNSMFDLWLLLVFGVMGYLLRKGKFPLAPVVLSLVLGPMMEQNLRNSLKMSHGSLVIFFERPISCILIIISLLLLFLPIAINIFKMIKKNHFIKLS
ncbi:MAG: tripartite tricarboxylate transporter permease [Dehalobacterium sp.]